MSLWRCPAANAVQKALHSDWYVILASPKDGPCNYFKVSSTLYIRSLGIDNIIMVLIAAVVVVVVFVI